MDDIGSVPAIRNQSVKSIHSIQSVIGKVKSKPALSNPDGSTEHSIRESSQ